MSSKLFYSPREAAQALSMGLDEIDGWMKAGRLKYACKAKKRRIFTEDLDEFARWYRKEYLKCPSTSPKEARTGSTTSNVIGVDFADRSTA